MVDFQVARAECGQFRLTKVVFFLIIPGNLQPADFFVLNQLDLSNLT